MQNLYHLSSFLFSFFFLNKKLSSIRISFLIFVMTSIFHMIVTSHSIGFVTFFFLIPRYPGLLKQLAKSGGTWTPCLSHTPAKSDFFYTQASGPKGVGFELRTSSSGGMVLFNCAIHWGSLTYICKWSFSIFHTILSPLTPIISLMQMDLSLW